MIDALRRLGARQIGSGLGYLHKFCNTFPNIVQVPSDKMIPVSLQRYYLERLGYLEDEYLSALKDAH